MSIFLINMQIDGTSVPRLCTHLPLTQVHFIMQLMALEKYIFFCGYETAERAHKNSRFWLNLRCCMNANYILSEQKEDVETF